MPSEAPRLAVVRLAFVIAMIAAPAPAMSATAPAPATERILDNSGGRIGSYLTKYEALRKSGHGVAIDGPAHRLARIGLHASA